MKKESFDEHAATELELYIDNDGDLYRQQGQPIIKNLSRKKEKGIYDKKKAEKLYGYLAQNGAKKYCREFGCTPYQNTFNAATRREVARRLARKFEVEYRVSKTRPSFMSKQDKRLHKLARKG
jgi:hypothetical protein